MWPGGSSKTCTEMEEKVKGYLLLPDTQSNSSSFYDRGFFHLNSGRQSTGPLPHIYLHALHWT